MSYCLATHHAERVIMTSSASVTHTMARLLQIIISKLRFGLVPVTVSMVTHTDDVSRTVLFLRSPLSTAASLAYVSHCWCWRCSIFNTEIKSN